MSALDIPASDRAPPTLIVKRIARLGLRYGLTSFGPLSISAAHFLASVVFLRALPRAEFGLLSFLLVVVPFGLSISGALVGASVSRIVALTGEKLEEQLATHFKVSLLYSLLAGSAVAGLMSLSGAGGLVSVLLGLYACLMAVRWFGRNVSYARGSPLCVALSDLAYSAVLTGSVAGLSVLHRLDVDHAGTAFFLAAAIGLGALGPDFVRRLLFLSQGGSLSAFAGVWRDLARWSVLGVFLTELTANAHAYLVTFIFGPSSFALLAVGALLMRPATLVLSALPDRERPEMAQRLAAGDMNGAFRCVKEFRTAAGAVWLATLLLAGSILMWLPGMILRHGYDTGQVCAVLLIWGAITLVRVARTPESVLLQAAGQFRELAGAAAWSSGVSLILTLALALTAGPIASLGGVLIGDLVMTGRIFSLSTRWRAAHG
jgi:O-antigen/teichoic acid export membrane protein